MKKLIALIAALCLVFALGLNYLPELSTGAVTEQEAQTEPDAGAVTDAQDTQEDTATAVTVQSLDYEALYALHEPEEIVITVDGQEVAWDEYFSWLYLSAQQTQEFLSYMAMYGMELGWGDMVGDDPEETYASTAMAGGESTLRQIYTIQGYALAQGIEEDEQVKATVEEQRESDMALTVGEEGSLEEFQEYLRSIYRSPSAYDRAMLAAALSSRQMELEYGSENELVTDEEALGYLEENGYMAADHILLMTTDPETGEALDADQVLAQAQELALELQAIEDPQQRRERFRELKQELDQDTGKESYPDGYVFQSGQMVGEFESTAQALEPFQVSDPVETSYGYHVMMGLALDPDMLVSYSSDGQAMDARALYANYSYAAGLDAYLEQMSFEYAPGFTPPDLAMFTK